MPLKTYSIRKTLPGSTARRSANAALVLAGALFIGLLPSCQSDLVYSRQHHLENSSWAISDTMRYSVEITDTLNLYDFIVSLRNTTDYPYSNIFLFINTRFPQGQVSTDTLEFMLSDEFGKWLGSGNGYYRENDILYRYNLRFQQPGEYTFDIVHAMRADTLTGIDEVGFTLRHAKYPPKDGKKK